MKLWIARDKDGELYKYTVKPKRSKACFYSPYVDKEVIKLNNNLFPEVTWENSPKQVD